MAQTSKSKSRGRAKSFRSDREAQRQRFIEAARKAEASEDEALFDETLRRLARNKSDKKSEKGQRE